MKSNDRYVIMCVFSDDVMPGEQITVHGFEVDSLTGESVYEDGKEYLAKFIVLNDNLERIEYVPDNRKIYLAVSFTPDYVNTGILSVLRGRYIEEEDPLSRLDPDAAQKIADDLGLKSVKDLKYLSRSYIGEPKDPTPEMKAYVRSDNHEIIADLFTVSVDEDGAYYTMYTLPDDVWEAVKGQKVSSYKFYGLNNSDESNTLSADVKSSFSIIYGLINAYEITGGRMEFFSVQTFILAGFLQAGTPLSVYLGKLLLLLLAGCNGGITCFIFPVLIAGAVIFKYFRKH